VPSTTTFLPIFSTFDCTLKFIPGALPHNNRFLAVIGDHNAVRECCPQHTLATTLPARPPHATRPLLATVVHHSRRSRQFQPLLQAPPFPTAPASLNLH